MDKIAHLTAFLFGEVYSQSLQSGNLNDFLSNFGFVKAVNGHKYEMKESKIRNEVL